MEEPDFFNKGLSSVERSLYDRQFRLSGWSQKLLKNARVLIAGVGGLGCEVAKNLAMLGISKLDLVDLDIIEHSNLNRQILFVGAKMGQPKAKVAANKLKEINPHITVKGYYTSLERLDPAIYKAADVVVGGLDSTNARLNLNAQCIRFKKPLVDGGVSGYHGHIYTTFPYINACFECNPLPESEIDEMAACTVVGKPRKRVHCVLKANMFFIDKFNKEPDPKNLKHIKFLQKAANTLVERHNFYPLFTEAEVYQLIDKHDPGLITINAVISSLQSHETIKIINWLAGNKKLGEPIKSYVIFNAMTMKLYYIEKKRNPNCRQCGSNVKRIDIKINRREKCNRIVDKIIKLGFTEDPEMEPILTIMDFDMIREIDLELNSNQNKLRNLELITAAGFKEGELLINLHLV
ncbi:MAG: ThiF family adenylyltransferase [Candidatus Helarchaeota archaeon]